MATPPIGRVGILWRGDRDASESATPKNNRLRPLYDALTALNVAAEPVIFADELVDEARAQLRQLDGVLIWVDPITGGKDRSRLDALLREVSSQGTWVSAHPDVILKMGTKEVLFQTRDLGWGSDTYLYKTIDEFNSEFPALLAAAGPRVLKQHRGNGGIGVWKVALAENASNLPLVPLPGDVVVRVQDAQPRDTVTEQLPLRAFMERCEEYLGGSGCIVDQPFQPRIAEGMIRCYMVTKEVAGFSTQSPDPLAATTSTSSMTPGSASHNVFGLPSKKTMYDASEPRFQPLRARMESDWVSAMQRLLDVDDASLPLLWDADFLYGPKTGAGRDTYVLCEINVSSVSPFPESVVGKLAQAVVARLMYPAAGRIKHVG